LPPRRSHSQQISSKILHSLPHSITTLAVKFGVMTPAFNVRTDTISIVRVFAVKFKELANSSIVNKESVKNATKDIQLSMENV
jgi:hypothetical protein